ncbi:hypothetical protein DFJ43DRAFT_994410 [Lentinula guzmanii]|uniref:C2H2-type domain-containing protein n=1 Tax=Lentinula guzmanii TaxID=2804957 RepID=A0AA38JL71_9AGAR|nr:hypothetical protein DFJ43DRAFT_994410 [Lentinula guzmanii]
MSESADNSLDQSPKLADLEEDWDENEEEYDEDDGDDDIDAQAEEMARKLNEQLWEDMRRAAATESISSTPMEAHSAPTSTPQEDSSHIDSASSHKEEAVLATIKAIMALLTHDPIAHNTLASTALPSTSFSSVLDALNQILATRTVSKAIALVLSQALVTLVGSEVLFGALKGHDAQAKLLGKRKREEEPVALLPLRHPSIYDMVSNAVHIVTHALHTSSSINPALINSIQDSLQHIFLFSISLSARPVEEGASTPNAVLQEISGLIQVLGVLSGIQIGVNISHEPGQTTDTITMVYPCIVPSCNKTFIQLANLRAHEHAHHSQSNPSVNPGNATATYERPFPCTYPSCSASFLRNHDLKRHVKVAHERKSFKCGGCGKTFSRRDAIKRHKDASMTKSQHMLFPGRPVLPCYESEVVEVEGEGDDQDGPDDDDSSPDMKRARTDDELGTNALQEGGEEEGEILEETINSTRAVIMQLHPLLRAVVAKASGTPLPLIPLHSSIETVDPPATHSSSSSPKLVSDPALISTDEHPAPKNTIFPPLNNWSMLST